VRTNAVYEEARTSEKKKRERTKDLFTRTFMFEDVKRYEADIILLLPSSQRIFPNSSHFFFD